IEQLSEVEFTGDAMEHLASKTNQFRQIVKLLDKIEKLSKTNNIKTLDEMKLKEILGERKIIENLQAVKSLHA
ncbi:MAG: hypothetical protein LBK53_09190, partial [Heliobacteriaceae bacterium]|nr:hypothetical protein [Heliobacteriaceae bacterium]